MLGGSGLSIGDEARVVTDSSGVVSVVGPGGNTTPSHAMPNAASTGLRIFGGRGGSFTTAASGSTFHTCYATSAGWDAMRFIFCNYSTTQTLPITLAKFLRIPDFSTPTLQNNGAGNFVNITFDGGNATVSIAVAPSAGRRTYKASDWISASSIGRSDGGRFDIVGVRTFHNIAATALGVFGNGTDNYTNWVTQPNGLIWLSRQMDGDGCTTPANFVSTTNISQSICVGVQYIARGRVISVMGAGDSIWEGRSTYLSEGFGVPACLDLTNEGKATYEWSNVALASGTSTTYAGCFQDVIAAGIIPDIIAAPNGTPNDNSTPIVSSNILVSRRGLAQILLTARDNKIKSVIGNEIPATTAAKNYGTSDSLRRDYNAETVARSIQGDVVVDMSVVISGDTVGGQVQPIPAAILADGLHPSDFGNALIKEPFKTAIRAYS